MKPITKKVAASLVALLSACSPDKQVEPTQAPSDSLSTLPANITDNQRLQFRHCELSDRQIGKELPHSHEKGEVLLYDKETDTYYVENIVR